MEPYREMERERRLYIGTNCHVLCIDAQSGETRWKTQIRSSIQSTLVSLLLHKGRIYASCWRAVACLDCSDGRTLWNTEFARLAEPAALALDPTVPGGQLLVAAGGVLYALSAESGAVIWDNQLPGLGYHPICLRTDAPGVVVAQPAVRYYSSGKSVTVQVLEDSQSESLPE